jgi:hypothetical protein
MASDSMTTWKPPHRTAQQRRRDRDPVARKVDRAALAPSMPMPANRCVCGHMRLVHRLTNLRLGWADPTVACYADGCDCTDFTKETT